MKYLWIGLSLMMLSCGGAARSTAEYQPMNEKSAIQYDFAVESYRRGDLIPALSSALKAAEITPKNAEIHNLMGLIYFRQGDLEKAEAEFQKAFELDPKLSEAMNNLGSLYYHQGRFEDAKILLNRALENPLYLYPEKVYNNLGLVEVSLGQQTAAKQSYERAIQLKPNFYLPYLNLAKLHLDLQEKAAAKPLLRKAAELCEICAEPRYRLGLLLVEEKRSEDAIKLFKEGAEAEPQSAYGQLCKEMVIPQ